MTFYYLLKLDNSSTVRRIRYLGATYGQTEQLPFIGKIGRSSERSPIGVAVWPATLIVR